jgi:hypothetical protein
MVVVIAGVTLVLIGGASLADAAGRYGHVHPVSHTHLHARSTAGKPAPLSCAHQPNLDDPTNSSTQALTTYYFDVTHAGVTNSYCRLGFHVSAGDIMSVHFTPIDRGETPTLAFAVYVAPGLDPDQQTLSTCSSNRASSLCGAAVSGDVLTVQAPSCGFQVDFIYGNVIANLTQGTYRTESRLIDGRTGSLSTSGCSTPTPTPTPAPATPTPAPTAPQSGVLAASVSTPDTGAGSAVQSLGMVLLLLGLGSVYASRRYLAATDL